MQIKLFLRRYWRSIIVVACIAYLSFAPPGSFKQIPTFRNEDKLIHLLMYVGLAAALMLDYKKASSKTNINSIIFVSTCLVFPVLLGGLIEIFQPILSFPRSASWLDWLADISGVLLVWLGLILFTPNTTKKNFK